MQSLNNKQPLLRVPNGSLVNPTTIDRKKAEKSPAGKEGGAGLKPPDHAPPVGSFQLANANIQHHTTPTIGVVGCIKVHEHNDEANNWSSWWH